MRLILCIPLLLSACSIDSGEPRAEAPIREVGRIENKNLDETSGLAQSRRFPDVLWAINDDGPAVVYAMDHAGKKRGKVTVNDATNRDWEDIAAFTLDGQAYLAIADIGNNESDEEVATIFVIPEPEPGADDVDVAWQIDFTYPDGPRDAEALAADPAGEHFYILSKRDIPAILYRLPMRPQDSKPLVAAALGELRSLPQPSEQEVKNAEQSLWAWQPTGMDFSYDGRSAVVLTYRGVYYYSRTPEQTWAEALQSQALGLELGKFKDAESIAFDATNQSVFVTTEKKHAPLLRIDLASVRPKPSVTIMTFNVENLFDNRDDPGKDDKAFLPIAAKQSFMHINACNEIEVASWRDQCLSLDWSDETLAHKLGVLAETIRQLNDGRGADVIAFQEVENAAILDRLRLEFLPDLDYGPAILVEGDDSRGIDVAFLSRLPVIGEPILHPLVIPGFEDRIGDTRGVLQASFRLPDGQTLTGFSVHFPAPFHPTEMRIAAYKHLNELRLQLPEEDNVFAAGDFNTTSIEDDREGLLEHYVQPHWIVAHEHCEGCPGTHYYARDDSWSFLDMLLFSPGRGGKTTWKIRADSVRLANQTGNQVQPPGIPQRYNAVEQRGVSDHWPLALELEPTQKQ